MVYVHKYDVAIHSRTQIQSCCHCTHNECPVEWCCHYGIRDHQSLPFLTNSLFLHTFMSTHMMLPSRTTNQSLLWTTLYAWNGRPVKWCCHQGSPDWHMSHQYTCTHWRPTNQSLLSHDDAVHVLDTVPASDITTAMMQSTSLIQCQRQTLPQPWCSPHPWYSASIRHYHSHDAVHVLDTVPASDITTAMLQSMSLMQCQHQTLPQPWCSPRPWCSVSIRHYHSHDAVHVLDTVPESGHQCQPWLLDNPFMHTEKHLYKRCCHQKCCTAVSHQQSTRVHQSLSRHIHNDMLTVHWNG